MVSKVTPPAGHGRRHDRMITEYEHDSYKLPGKLKEPTVCPECRAVFHKGRWAWGAVPSEAEAVTCPACHRIKDKYPKGLLTLKGSFVEKEHEQVAGLARRIEAKENKNHPLSRIMMVERRPEGIVLSTTDTHLPRRIGEALKHAYHGELDFHYDQDEDFVRVTWIR